MYFFSIHAPQSMFQRGCLSRKSKAAMTSMKHATVGCRNLYCSSRGSGQCKRPCWLTQDDDDEDNENVIQGKKKLLHHQKAVLCFADPCEKLSALFDWVSFSHLHRKSVTTLASKICRNGPRWQLQEFDFAVQNREDKRHIG